jgi:hypothetical protein
MIEPCARALASLSLAILALVTAPAAWPPRPRPRCTGHVRGPARAPRSKPTIRRASTSGRWVCDKIYPQFALDWRSSRARAWPPERARRALQVPSEGGSPSSGPRRCSTRSFFYNHLFSDDPNDGLTTPSREVLRVNSNGRLVISGYVTSDVPADALGQLESGANSRRSRRLLPGNDGEDEHHGIDERPTRATSTSSTPASGSRTSPTPRTRSRSISRSRRSRTSAPSDTRSTMVAATGSRIRTSGAAHAHDEECRDTVRPLDPHDQHGRPAVTLNTPTATAPSVLRGPTVTTSTAFA